jgi:glycosyltransferase involved in cell wall biosynthesis
MEENKNMRMTISTARQAHYRLPANSFLRRGHSLSMYSSTPANRFKGFDTGIDHHFIPAPMTLFNAMTRLDPGVFLSQADCRIYDRLVSLSISECDALLGAASSSLDTARVVKSRGGKFVLDRACPDIRVQQSMMIEEARKVGTEFKPSSAAFVERQVAEYEEADYIISPSDYSRRSFPEHLRKKVILAPLFGRSSGKQRRVRNSGSPFVVGVVGGNPLRKGYLYLLQAWKELALPNAQLKLRSTGSFNDYPVLAKMLAEQENVSVIPYVPDIGDFYAQCDVFVLPSIDDGFGMALFEAVAHGVPAIATRNCGSTELLEGGRDLLLIDAFSVNQLKEALLSLYESPELRERIASNGLSTLNALQSGPAFARYEEGIDQLLDVLGCE